MQDLKSLSNIINYFYRRIRLKSVIDALANAFLTRQFMLHTKSMYIVKVIKHKDEYKLNFKLYKKLKEYQHIFMETIVEDSSGTIRILYFNFAIENFLIC